MTLILGLLNKLLLLFRLLTVHLMKISFLGLSSRALCNRQSCLEAAWTSSFPALQVLRPSPPASPTLPAFRSRSLYRYPLFESFICCSVFNGLSCCFSSILLFVFLSFLSFSLLFIGKLFLLGSVFSWGPGSFLHQSSISFVSCLSRRLCLRQVGGTLRLSEFRI